MGNQMKKITWRKMFLLVVFVFVLLPMTGAEAAEEYKGVLTGIDQDNGRLTEIFKKIHSDPELSFEEIETGKLVKLEMEKLGYKIITPIGKTGIVAIMENGVGPVVMYRADMDALAVKEITGLDYASTKTVQLDSGSEVPVMHACGHDAHVTWMLGTAKAMAENKDLWSGTLVFVGQPAEEVGLGAHAMIADQMYQKGVPVPDYLYALHTAPLPVNTFVAEDGLRMAGTDQIDITFNGVGGHGSSPHLAKDPIVMATTAVNSYQMIVSRGIDPQNAAVLTVGSIQAGNENNVIPASALLKVNLRWFNEKDRELMINGMQRINDGIAYSYGLNKELYPTLQKKGWAAPVNNDYELTHIVDVGIQKYLSEAKSLKGLPAALGSEDFHHLVLDNPHYAYTLLLVGVADPEIFATAQKNGQSFPYFLHNGNFKVDLKAITYGTKIGTVGLLEIFNSQK